MCWCYPGVMLARRVIIALTLNDGVLFRTKRFRPDRWYNLDLVDLELADELVLLDVSRYPGGVPDDRGDFYRRLHDFTERLFLPLIRLQLPEVVDLNLPIEGVFHNLAIVSIRKRFPGQARHVMHALWGLGQMMFTKIIVVLDEEAKVHDLGDVIWRLGNHIDPQRDVCFVEGPVDALNHASPQAGFGSKMGIDATRKLPEEGHPRPWPDEITMTPEVKRRVDALWEKLGL